MVTNTQLPRFEGDSFYLRLHVNDVKQIEQNITLKIVGYGYDMDMLFEFKNNKIRVHRYSKDFANDPTFIQDRLFNSNLNKTQDLWIDFYVDRSNVEINLSNGDIYTMSKFSTGRSREIITVNADNPVKFDYEYYQIE